MACPNIIIVGFTNKAIDESKERIRSAFASAKLELPRKRITINLDPAGGQISHAPERNVVFIGEMGLDQ